MMRQVSLVTVMISAMGCGSGTNTQDTKSATDTTKTATVAVDTAKTAVPAGMPTDTTVHDAGAKVAEREPKGDELREFGEITKVEDGTYPMKYITIVFPERKLPPMKYDANVEADGLQELKAGHVQGKYASFFYTTELVPAVNDMKHNGISVLGKDAPKTNAAWKTVTGTLHGAESASGDLPSHVSIKDKGGKDFKFDFFISDDMTKLNGKVVTAYYTTQTENKLTYLHVQAKGK